MSADVFDGSSATGNLGAGIESSHRSTQWQPQDFSQWGRTLAGAETGQVSGADANRSSFNGAAPWPFRGMGRSQAAEAGDQVAWWGNSVPARLANVLARRMMDAERLNAVGGKNFIGR
jgi:hypothetical protein